MAAINLNHFIERVQSALIQLDLLGEILKNMGLSCEINFYDHHCGAMGCEWERNGSCLTLAIMLRDMDERECVFLDFRDSTRKNSLMLQTRYQDKETKWLVLFESKAKPDSPLPRLQEEVRKLLSGDPESDGSFRVRDENQAREIVYMMVSVFLRS